jgi:hypothetical protein
MARRTAKFLRVYSALFFCTLNSPLVMPAIAGQAPPKIVSFPSQSQAISPNARYVVVGEQNHAEPFHTAILEDRVLKTRRKLFDYDRHIDLLWNPDSKSFAVTDYEESDYSRCSIIFTDRTVPTIRVWDKLVNTLTDRERKSLLENHHVYIAAVEWIGAGALKVKVWGYGEVNHSGFTQFYRYDRNGSVERLAN